MSKLHRLPTIPEYYREHINKSVDLLSEPKQCCPFHKEDTPSFSFSAEKGVCSCFGGCKLFGMDVIALHARNWDIKSRAEAEKHLKSMYGVEDKVSLKQTDVDYYVNDDKIYQEGVYQVALIHANSVERWLELDYIMSKTPIDITELKHLLSTWGVETTV